MSPDSKAVHSFIPRFNLRLSSLLSMPRRRTKRPLSVKVARHYHDQADCPLFNRIPPEIRNEIFALALSSYDDKSQPFPLDSYFSRPGYRYIQRIDTNLLATCRRIYLETFLVPVKINEHVFWCYRGPYNGPTDPSTYFRRLTTQQRDAVTNVHFFAQMFWLEGSFPDICRIKVMRPKSIKITIRHSDWWFWEDNNSLDMKDEWGRTLNEMRGLKELELELELETMERDKDQLNAIAARIATWRFDLHDGRILSNHGTSIVRHQWVGPSTFEGSLRYSAERNQWEEIGSNATSQAGLVYCIVCLKWQAAA